MAGPVRVHLHLEDAGPRPGRRRPGRPRRRRAGRPPVPRRRRQGRLRVRARGLRLVGRGARPAPWTRRRSARTSRWPGVDVTCAVVGERWQVGSDAPRGHRAAHALLEAGRAHGERRVPRLLRRRRAARAPTCACSRRASSAPATRWPCSTSRVTGSLVGSRGPDLPRRPRPLRGAAPRPREIGEEWRASGSASARPARPRACPASGSAPCGTRRACPRP